MSHADATGMSPIKKFTRSCSKSPDESPQKTGTFNLPEGQAPVKPKDIIDILKEKAQRVDVELLAQTKTNKKDSE